MTAHTLRLVPDEPRPFVTDNQMERWRGSKNPAVNCLVAEVDRLTALIEPVTVCASCLKASCWNDGLHPTLDRCDSWQFSGSVDLPIMALEFMGREHPDNWK